MARDRTPGSWSWQLGTIAGIRVLVHPTFLLLVAWFAATQWLHARSAAQAGSAVVFLLLLFGCVLLHELGHALMARRFGYATREITLLPIGGIARLARIPDDPRQSFWITVAGPAVNAAIAVVLFAVLRVTGAWQPLDSAGLSDGAFVEQLLLANVSLVVFNLLPAFPMDGGRALRALLATWLDDRRATHIAARLGQWMAVLFAFVGLLGSPLLILIALFVWAGATAEAAMADVRASLHGVRVTQAMRHALTTVAPDDPLSVAVDLVQRGGQHDFPVVDHDHVAGLLARDDLVRGVRRHGLRARVGEMMDPDALVVGPMDMVADVLGRLDEEQKPAALVVSNDRIIGLISRTGIAEFLTLHAALDHAA